MSDIFNYRNNRRTAGRGFRSSGRRDLLEHKISLLQNRVDLTQADQEKLERLAECWRDIIDNNSVEHTHLRLARKKDSADL